MEQLTPHGLCMAALLLSTAVQAQGPRLWGMTTGGGANDQGTLFRIDADGTDFTVVHHFDTVGGYGPEGTLCQAANGKLYGTTNLGGNGQPAAGTLFSFDPSTGTYATLVDFNITNGGFGWGGLTTMPDGMLYGSTYGGGSGGSIFRVDPTTDTYTIVYSLDQAQDGGAITNRLQRGGDGLLYGTAAYGGANNAGTLFRFNTATSTFTKLHDLGGGINGDTPYGSLCDGGNGWFYGTTYDGGTGDEGILFKYAPASNTFVKLLDYTGANGQSPWNSPVVAGADQLFGTVAIGGTNGSGLIYRLQPSNDLVQEVYSFSSSIGGLLFGNVSVAGDGQLYGMSSFGGQNFEGTIYRLDPSSGELTTLHSFTGSTDGQTPRGDLLLDDMNTGVDAPGAEASFTVSPNPSQGALRITLSDATMGSALFRVTNAWGATVMDGPLLPGINELQLNGAPGLYLLSVTRGGNVRTERLVVE
jgi:uncharacterized repeat protein (TIGR03803 family)